MRRLAGAVLLIIACAGLWIGLARRCTALTLVSNGKPAATIVIPADPLGVESYAAYELQYHVKAATGADLRIVRENEALPTGAHVFLGHCNAAKPMWFDPADALGNQYVIKEIGKDLYIVGKDAPGDPLSDDTKSGTLFGVYDLLENNMGVKWLWPGKLGEVIPKSRTATFSVPVNGKTVKPRLLWTRWRTTTEWDSAFDVHKDNGGYSSFAKYEQMCKDERIWLRRQRFGRSRRPGYGHSMTRYWDRYGQTHPEYFMLRPDGKRGPDPKIEGTGETVAMCVAEPGLWKQKVADWASDNPPEPFINLCENDTWGGCTCPKCMAWDAPDHLNPIAFDGRLAEAKRIYANSSPSWEDGWPRVLGSLSDRYAKYVDAVYHEAVKISPDVKTVFYAYGNYQRPPTQTKMNKNEIIGIVPDFIWPYNKGESDTFRKQWQGWADSGCSLFLRPNYTMSGHCFPYFYAHTIGTDIQFAYKHSLQGADFDSLNGQWAAQGPTYYVLARELINPDQPVDDVLDEYYSAFGPAKSAIKDYWDHWEKVTASYTTERAHQLEMDKAKYGHQHLRFYPIAVEIYSPKAFAQAEQILVNARHAAKNDPEALARVEWVGQGLKQAELVFAAEKAFEHAVDTKDTTGFRQAYRELKAFRKQIEDNHVSNLFGLTHFENGNWDVLGEGVLKGD